MQKLLTALLLVAMLVTATGVPVMAQDGASNGAPPDGGSKVYLPAVSSMLPAAEPSAPMSGMAEMAAQNGQKKGRIKHADRIAAAQNAAKIRGAAGVVAVPNAAMAAPLTVPDYFGTIPNWALSPLPPSVSIMGDGQGAIAVPIITGGAVTGFTILNGGTGYTVAATSINVIGGGGSGGKGTPTINATTGAITAIAVPTGGGGSGYGSTPAIRKFVDTLPGLTAAGANNLGNYIPTAVPDKTTYANKPGTPDADYYEIALVQFTQQLHRDLAPTTVRGYVQLETTVVKGNAATRVPLFYPNSTTPIYLPGTTQQAVAVDKPSYLGPLISADRDRPVRVKFYNLLPPTSQGGNLFLPVDTTVMGAGAGPNGGNYTENRATLHLHGGTTPWISDGTQHQWTTPANEATAYPKGVSVGYVPDMDGGTETPNGGVLTFYYTNQQSARLMFYHDHAYGITRLNVYAGEAAGYLLQDPVEQALVKAGTIPADQIPLIIQDKTFVPSATQLAAEDPTWDTAKFGQYGNLWFPHVYMPNQNPYDVTGANAMGRWDYGPWFWPPFTGITNPPITNPLYNPTTAPWEPPLMPATPNPSIVPEGFMDTPLVNGTAYPVLNVDPKAYRLRILNAANDRYMNLSLYQAASSNPMWDAAGNLLDANAGEVPMVPANPDPALPFPVSWTTATGGQGIRPDILDGRVSGVPNPNNLGPSWIQIGTEGGLLPAPVVIPPSPTGYDYNPRNVVVLNVTKHSLYLGPAERADVVVDFSGFAGKTFILYNDAPAPMPAGDPRVDYYTGDPDFTGVGGAPSTQPGYGPNTRTVMQIKVANTTSAPAFDLVALQAALPAAFGQSQPAPIVPQAPYNAAFKATYPTNNYVTISANNYAFFNGPLSGINVVNAGSGYTTPPLVNITGGGGTGATATATIIGASVTGIPVVSGGSNYSSPPTVTIDPPTPGGTQATATAIVNNKKVVTGFTITNKGSGYITQPAVRLTGGGGTGATAGPASIEPTPINTGIKVTMTSGGSGYTSAPTISFTGGGGTGAVAVALGTNMALQPKAIQELFDNDYGRMNALLGVEIPNTTGLNQTTIPYTDIDPATEIFKALPASAQATPIGTGADGTQLWKITHNGVDTHTIHWHMFNVQIINRVGWDGAIRFPDANEVGWKESVRMNPLEDIVVALRPIIPNLPTTGNWAGGLPNSVRLMDVTRPQGSTMDFTNVDPTGQPATVTNQLVNFGWEYVWHCHLLGHEENIMMRPIIFGVAPYVPTTVQASFASIKGKKTVTVTWLDGSKNETGFTVQRAPSTTTGVITGAWTTVGTVAAANGTGTTVTYQDQTVTTGTYVYRVIANNLVGYTQKYAAPAIGYPNQSIDSAPVQQIGTVTVQ